jgi:membrane-associated phospholipid phosphatase
VTPHGVWNLHAKQLALSHKLGAAEAARMFAALNAAMMDGAIASSYVKYKWWTARPVTVVRERHDPDFLPYVITPPHPSYVSGLSAISGAAVAVLGAFFKQDAAKLNAMAAEAAISRIYAGIHFRSDNEAGLELGRRIGVIAVAHLHEPGLDAGAERPRATGMEAQVKNGSASEERRATNGF